MGKLRNRDIKHLWKHQCPRGRFELSMADDLYQVYDTRYARCFRFGNGSRSAQVKGMQFCKNYVRIHGDINFNSMPWDYSDPPYWNPGDKVETEDVASQYYTGKGGRT